MKLFCFPYAGGSALFFNKLAELLQDDIEVISLEYPGHGKRWQEKKCNNIEELASILLMEVRQRVGLDESYSMLGYSMGTVVMTELLRQMIIAETTQLPTHAFLCAFAPYLKYYSDEKLLLKDDDFIKEQVIKFGGVPDKLLDNNSFWRMYIPIYREDFRMLSEYKLSPYDCERHISASIFYSESDTKRDDIKRWDEFFYNIKELVPFEGNHFFMEQHYKEISERIIKILA